MDFISKQAQERCPSKLHAKFHTPGAPGSCLLLRWQGPQELLRTLHLLEYYWHDMALQHVCGK